MKTDTLSYSELLEFERKLAIPGDDLEALALEAVMRAIFNREGRRRQVTIIEDALIALPPVPRDAALAALSELQAA